jgi:hypothetical protein
MMRRDITDFVMPRERILSIMVRSESNPEIAAALQRPESPGIENRQADEDYDNALHDNRLGVCLARWRFSSSRF